MLRINLYGNVSNNAYMIARFLRAAGIDAHLFLERGFQFLPEDDDPELHGCYPEWIHLTPDLRPFRYGVLDRWFVRRLAECDLVHTFYYGPIWATQTGRPSVFQAYGGDLTVFPFMTDRLDRRLLARRQRRALQATNLVILPDGHHPFCEEAVERLGLTRVAALPLPIDATRFRPWAAADVARARADYDAEWVFFHPTRHIWTDASYVKERKGNDLVFRAFARFLRDSRKTAILVAVAHGPDVAASRQLAREMEIAHAVRWIAPQTRHALVAYYNAADLVLDQFLNGTYGGCACEAWACGKPVFVYLNRPEDYYERPAPAVNVRTEEDIYKRLLEYTEDRRALEAVGHASRQWILEHKDGPRLIQRYIAAYERVLGER